MYRWRLIGYIHLDAKLFPTSVGATITVFLNSIINERCLVPFEQDR
jgi:hypothetical protein